MSLCHDSVGCSACIALVPSPGLKKIESQMQLRDKGIWYFNKDPYVALFCQGGMLCNVHT